jgi:preprotein translocase subunit YajC
MGRDSAGQSQTMAVGLRAFRLIFRVDPPQFTVFALMTPVQILVPAMLANTPAPQAPNMLMQMLPFILLMLGFWFLLIQPQRKKQKELEKLITALKPGDAVITTGGICGVITHVRKDRFQVKVDDNTRIEVLRGAIAGKDSEPR